MLDNPVIITAGRNAVPIKNSMSFDATGANNKAPNAPDNAKKLDDATESSKIDKLRHGKDIMQARTSKKMTRKQLAARLSLKEEVIAGFENNSVLATPANKQILNKIKRCLSIK